MKKITKTVIALSVLAGLASCNKEQTPVAPEVNDGKIVLTLSAEQENSETRAAIDSKDSKVIDWTADDCLSVFEASLVGSATNNKFTLTDGAGTNSGKFSGTVSSTSTSLIVIHPYSSSLSLSGLSLTGAELKTEQTATAGSFDHATALMAGVIPGTSTPKSVTMNNVVGYVKVCPQFECQKITLESKSADDKLSGTVSATYNAASGLSFTSTGSSNKASIKGTIESGKTYYIAVLPVELTSGFKLIFTMKDGTEKYLEGTKTLSITKNKVWDLGAWKENELKVDYEDLSKAESANCYLIKKAGYYKFKAVQGNSTTAISNVNSVEVLWESFGTSTTPDVGALIAKASYSASDNYIQFSATSAQGNAVIAARDANKNILWSWHIWCASEGWKEQIYKNSAGTMMDRNLGATTANAGEVGSLGLLYQWGRKDPFLGSSSVSSSTQALSTGTWSIKSDATSADSATQNPMTFYTNYTYGSWASTKTEYDPCPAGWRVPDGGSDGIWAKANTSVSFFPTGGSYGLNFGGVFGSDATIWYPASGYLYQESGVLCIVGSNGSYWSVTPDPSIGGAWH